MLYVNSGFAPRQTAYVLPGEEGEHFGLSTAPWIDLCEPTGAECAAARRGMGVSIPGEMDLSEIETSSRLSVLGDVITLSTPMTYHGQDGQSLISPLGFVLSPRQLLTVRFVQMPVFDIYCEKFAGAGKDGASTGGASTGSASTGAAGTGGADKSSAGAFVGLLEAIVDRLADVLEHVGTDLSALSTRIFQPGGHGPQKTISNDKSLRLTLRQVGLAGERVSNIRDSLLGLSRIVGYVADAASGWLPPLLIGRLTTLKHDIASLADYDNQITNKVQFLLDATLGFINIDQAEGIKVLTVVSLVGVPPTLIASIYGMNFKIPELQWDYGYAFGLTMIVLGAVLPFVWFKRQGWV